MCDGVVEGRYSCGGCDDVECKGGEWIRGSVGGVYWLIPLEKSVSLVNSNSPRNIMNEETYHYENHLTLLGNQLYLSSYVIKSTGLIIIHTST
ncbi:hypothetical protein QVD17_33815 [Tagetes erecta]|uniref:Uncharacterized protein n=1 Tax=Tagetes erecta TaxID=13708 RepID=A0AAD8JXT2_TARER|nr:hypothetical protein QVD17_33815 [Tagetes erecta]